jgi:uridine phosphorylase
MASPEKHELELQELLVKEMNWPAHLPKPYFARAHENMISHVGNDMIQGITMTANGFYGPQGRSLRLSLRDSELHDKFRQFTWRGYVITNLEMECAGLYSLGAMLGHQMGTACVILANRYTGAFTNNPQEHINSLIDSSLERLTRI